MLDARDSRLGFVLGLWVASASLFACSTRKVGDDRAGESVGDSTESTTLSTDDQPNPDCEPILQEDGSPSGFEQCMNGDTVRTSAQTCTDPHPVSDGSTCNYGYCFSDEDCKEKPYGACQLQDDLPPNCGCEYGCTNDAECGPGFACLCAPVDRGTVCIEAGCRSDSDCSPGYRCAFTPSSLWGYGASLHCHGPDDECQSDADCIDGTCRWAKERWECE